MTTLLPCPKGVRAGQQCAACDKLHALAELRTLCPPGTTVYTILRSVSRSGMSRTVQPVVVNEHGQPQTITGLVASAIGVRTKDGACVMGGCGMDVGFELVYSLSRALWADTFTCIGQDCRSNDHSNGDRDYTPGHKHSDGGYALTHRWL